MTSKTVGIFEAKTHFSQLCDQVVLTGQPLVVERRGKALVTISPLEPVQRQDGEDILAAWERWEREHPGEEGDFPDVSGMRANKTLLPFS